LYVQLHIYATNSIAICVHPNIVVKIKNKSFCKLAWHGPCSYEMWCPAAYSITL